MKAEALLGEMRARFQMVDVLPDSQTLLLRNSFTLDRSQSVSVKHCHTRVIFLGRQQVRAMKLAGKMVVVYGIVKYRDIFDELRETTFGYKITPGRELVPLEGKHEYNKYT